MDDAVVAYFAAWNEPDPDQRRRLLERSVTDNAELVDPTGRWQGIDGLAERIGCYQSAAPDTKIVPDSGIDAHNHVVRYAWTIVDAEGRNVMDGIDVAERVDDGRLKRILMFHGPLPTAGQ
jgi:SnoaL-like protein